jgi:hypothetical protein
MIEGVLEKENTLPANLETRPTGGLLQRVLGRLAGDILARRIPREANIVAVADRTRALYEDEMPPGIGEVPGLRVFKANSLSMVVDSLSAFEGPKEVSLDTDGAVMDLCRSDYTFPGVLHTKSVGSVRPGADINAMLDMKGLNAITNLPETIVNVISDRLGIYPNTDKIRRVLSEMHLPFYPNLARGKVKDRREGPLSILGGFNGKAANLLAERVGAWIDENGAKDKITVASVVDMFNPIGLSIEQKGAEARWLIRRVADLRKRYPEMKIDTVLYFLNPFVEGIKEIPSA